VLEALRAGTAVERLYLLESLEPSESLDEIVRRAKSSSATVTRLGKPALDRLAGGGNHQGVVAEVATYDYASLDDLLRVAESRGEAPLLLMLDSLQDTHNLGSLIRTAEAVGAHGLVLPKHRSVGVTGAVVKASAGAIEHLRVAQVNGIAAAITELKSRGVWIVGLSSDAGLQYDRHDYTSPSALVVGAEGEGLSRLVSERCDVLVRIPSRGKVSSLNASVAGSIVLYHAWQSRVTAASKE
jgi:23S rRNA (guanosine2251-2'-O)-methyltransferase